jgi:flagellar protein FliO/FliZ
MRSPLSGAPVRFVLIGVVLFISSGFASAADKPFAAPQLNQAPTSATGGLAQVTFSLLLVLGVIFAAAWGLKRLRGVGQRGASTLRVIANLSLGPKERAVLIQVGQQQLLVGVAPGQVTTLHVLTENVATEEPSQSRDPVNSASTPQVPADAFKAILKRSLGL